MRPHQGGHAITQIFFAFTHSRNERKFGFSRNIAKFGLKIGHFSHEIMLNDKEEPEKIKWVLPKFAEFCRDLPESVEVFRMCQDLPVSNVREEGPLYASVDI